MKLGGKLDLPFSLVFFLHLTFFEQQLFKKLHEAFSQDSHKTLENTSSVACWSFKALACHGNDVKHLL